MQRPTHQADEGKLMSAQQRELVLKKTTSYHGWSNIGNYCSSFFYLGTSTMLHCRSTHQTAGSNDHLWPTQNNLVKKTHKLSWLDKDNQNDAFFFFLLISCHFLSSLLCLLC